MTRPDAATTLLTLLLFSAVACATTTRIAPDHPAALYDAVQNAKPGDVIELADGTYHLTETIRLRAAGTAESPIHFAAAEGARPVLDFSRQAADSKNRGIELKGDHWRVTGLTIIGAGDNGINVTGHHNVIAHCTVTRCRDTGIQIHRPASHNLVTDCDSFRNFDDHTRGENADGFAAKFEVGPGNVFRRCRAWENADDGWDLWKAPEPVLIEDCLAFRNGVNWKGLEEYTGDGNGFKLGGDFIAGAHVVRRCVAVDHAGRGFDQNNNTGPLTIEDSTAIRCGTGFALPAAPASGQHTLRRNVTLDAPVDLADGSVLEDNHWLEPASE